MSFDAKEFLPAGVLAKVTDVRVTDPERSMRAAKKRRRRESLTRDGRLNILAADHPARRVTRVGDNPLRMADRREYMARILRVLMSDAVDGLLASFNRGGLLGSAWEIDDPNSGPTAASCKEWGLDGAKILLRICDDEEGSLKTLLDTVRAITELNAVGLPMFLESLPVVREKGGRHGVYRIVKTAEELARTAGAAAALGDSARYLWLKLPFCENYEMVANSTTLPILLLGGEPVGDATPFLRELHAGLRAGPNVRGALVGRNILFPGGDDPLAVIEAVGGIVHQGWTVEQALDQQAAHRGRDMDWLSRIA